MKKTNKLEIGRQLIHLSGIGAVFFAYVLGNIVTGTGALVISLGFLILSFYVKWKQGIRENLPIRIKKLEQMEDSFHDLINSVERESAKKKYMGPMLFFFAIGISLLVFPFRIAILSVIVLSVGDSFSTLIGVHFGRHKTKVNPKKSWEGTLAGLVASFMVCILYLSYVNPSLLVMNIIIAIVAASVGMFMEVMPFRVNDNLLMPFSVGIIIWILTFLGFVI